MASPRVKPGGVGPKGQLETRASVASPRVKPGGVGPKGQLETRPTS